MNVRAPLIASTLLLSSAAASDAMAYKLYMTDGDPAACAAGDEDKCPQPLRWWRRETVFTLGQVTPGEFALGEVRGLVDQAFDQWLDVDCATTASALGEVPVVAFGGNSAERRSTRPLTAKATPDNLIVFVPEDQWRVPQCNGCQGNSATWIAITKIAHDQSTGEIVDADIEINDGFTFSIDNSPAQDEVDFLSMLVHEVGHFYGLDHSLIEDATMFATYSQTVATATAARSIEQDDKEGICALYTNVPTRTTTPKDDEGCHGGAGLGLFGLLGLVSLRLYRRD